MLENRRRQDDEERINADKMKRGSRGFALGTTGDHSIRLLKITVSLFSIRFLVDFHFRYFSAEVGKLLGFG